MIKEVQNKTDERIFAQTGVRLSKTYPLAIPKFLEDELAYFDPSLNYFLKIGGKLKAFYLDDALHSGRIAAMIHPQFPERGLIGLFDCVDNQQFANELFLAAIQFLQSKGCKQFLGPVDFSIYQSYRFMTKGFDRQVYMGEPRNPEYYPVLWKNFGFVTAYHWISKELDADGMKAYLKKFKYHALTLDQLGYYQQPFNKSTSDQIMHETYSLMLTSYHDFPLFTDISEDDFMQLYKNLPRIVDPQSSIFAYNKKHEYVSFLLILKDYAQALKSMNSSSHLWAKIKFLWNAQKSTYAVIAQGGTVPRQIREAAIEGKNQFGQPLSLAYGYICKSIEQVLAAKKYRKIIFSLVRDHSFMQVHLADFDGEVRDYELFEYHLVEQDLKSK